MALRHDPTANARWPAPSPSDNAGKLCQTSSAARRPRANSTSRISSGRPAPRKLITAAAEQPRRRPRRKSFPARRAPIARSSTTSRAARAAISEVYAPAWCGRYEVARGDARALAVPPRGAAVRSRLGRTHGAAVKVARNRHHSHALAGVDPDHARVRTGRDASKPCGVIATRKRDAGAACFIRCSRPASGARRSPAISELWRPARRLPRSRGRRTNRRVPRPARHGAPGVKDAADAQSVQRSAPVRQRGLIRGAASTAASAR